MSSLKAKNAIEHLLRADGQEDLCFALWHPSSGTERSTAIIQSILYPNEDERDVHGNVEFTSEYFLRALGEATEQGAGVALMHSHPGGRGWQGLSSDDFFAETSHAAQAQAITGLPFLGLTIAGDGHWSGRFWIRSEPRKYEPKNCRLVSVVGDKLLVSFNPTIAPRPNRQSSQIRTVSAWGASVQDDLARLRVGIIGAGSVGALMAESVARIGVGLIDIIDFDTMETHNLDRQLHATSSSVGKSKAVVLAEAIETSATAEQVIIHSFEDSVCEPAGWSRALDCDVLISCVDRPWPRAVLNLIAYSHLVPVIDGGILVDARGGQFRGAHWRSHTVAPGRRCLECLSQFDPGLVQAEREGLLDDPVYIEGLPEDHSLRRNENVFAFSVGCAGMELAQFVCMIAAPGGVFDPAPQDYNLVTGTIDRVTKGCEANCPYTNILESLGDDIPIRVTGRHLIAELTREARQRSSSVERSTQRNVTLPRSRRVIFKCGVPLWRKIRRKNG